jgi:dTDP-4-dehydrorhamnose reductase
LARLIETTCRPILHYHHPPEGKSLENIYHGDLNDAAHVKYLSGIIDPNFIVNSAALADVDRCETEPELSEAINVVAVENLLRYLPKARFVQISTDYVFGDDEKRGPTLPKPEDEPRPVNIYGRHKLEAEQAVMSASPDNLVVRVNTLFDHTVERNFFRFVYDSLKAGKKVSGVSDQYSNPISASGAAFLILQLIEKEATGIFHLGGREVVSRYEFVRRIAEFFGLDQNLIEAATAEEISRPARRLKFSGLECGATEEFLELSMPDLNSEFGQLKIKMENNS